MDLTRMRAELDASGLTGLPDLGRRLDECPELIARAVRSIKVIDVNDATLRLFETDDKDALLGPLPILLEATGLAGFRPLIAAAEMGAELETEAAVSAIDVTARAPAHHYQQPSRPDLFEGQREQVRLRESRLRRVARARECCRIDREDGSRAFPSSLADTYLAVERRILQTGLTQVQVREPGAPPTIPTP